MIHDDASNEKSVEDMWDRTLTINGFSKAFSMTGPLIRLDWHLNRRVALSLPALHTFLCNAECRTMTGYLYGTSEFDLGYRLGYLAAPKDVVKAVSKLQSQCLGVRNHDRPRSPPCRLAEAALAHRNPWQP